MFFILGRHVTFRRRCSRLSPANALARLARKSDR